jgi:hypothetical protein
MVAARVVDAVCTLAALAGGAAFCWAVLFLAVIE